jgi:hypothetical protein
VNVQTNAPPPVVVILVPPNVPFEQEIGVWGTPLNDTVALEDTLNPVPVTVNDPLGVPWFGVKVIVGTVTLNDLVAVSVLLARSRPTTE